MRKTLTALLLCLTGCAAAPTLGHTAATCATYADFARQVAKDRDEAIPMAYAMQFYTMQVAGDAQHMASVAAIVRGVYSGQDAAAIQRKCQAGGFAPVKP